MKSLQAFWHWVDNERPRELTADSFRHLSDVADQALDDASSTVAERIGSPYRGVAALRDYWPAIRDLSLSICQAIERMHAVVPEGECEDQPGLRNVAIDECGSGMPMSYADGLKPLRDEAAFRREYVSDWIVPGRGGSINLGSDDNEKAGVNAQQHMMNALNAARPPWASYHGIDLSAAPESATGVAQRVNMQIAAADANGGGVVKLPAEADVPWFKREIRNEPVYRGPRYTYGHQTRQLDIYPHIDRAMCDCVRGCEPRSIVLHGDRSQYDEAVLPYLTRDVLAPMIADGALVIHQDPSFREFFTNERVWTLP